MWIKNLLVYVCCTATFILPPKANAAIEDELPGATIGYIIIDINDNNIIVQHNANKSLVRASLFKILTAAAATDILGSKYCFRTNLYASGPILNDTLYGNLIIEGTGDPTLCASLVDSLKSTNIKYITGKVKTNSSEPTVNPAWMVEDVGSDYGASWCHTNYKGNEILVSEGYHIPEFDAILTDLHFDMSMNDIRVGGELFPDSTLTLLSAISSERMPTLLKEMMHKSINLYAESFGRALSADYSDKQGLDILKNYCVSHGVDSITYRQVDFCGLARTNLITPASLASVLSYKANDINFTSLFPLAGKDGTVKRLLAKSGIKSKFALKTGSMSGVLAYAGYRITQSGKPTHAIVMIVNNSTLPTKDIRKHIEKWFMKYFL